LAEKSADDLYVGEWSCDQRCVEASGDVDGVVNVSFHCGPTCGDASGDENGVVIANSHDDGLRDVFVEKGK
jgi:hypothetical protein